MKELKGLNKITIEDISYGRNYPDFEVFPYMDGDIKLPKEIKEFFENFFRNEELTYNDITHNFNTIHFDYKYIEKYISYSLCFDVKTMDLTKAFDWSYLDELIKGDNRFVENVKQYETILAKRIEEKNKHPKKKSKANKKDKLLKAAYDLFYKQSGTGAPLNLLFETVVYDGAECDGYTIMQEIDEIISKKNY